jgi:hypothetical protein
MENVISALHAYPLSKRAVLTIPYPLSSGADGQPVQRLTIPPNAVDEESRAVLLTGAAMSAVAPVRASTVTEATTAAGAGGGPTAGSLSSELAWHMHTDFAKCLRELHFYLDHPLDAPRAGAMASGTGGTGATASDADRLLCCTGFMRAQAVSIFPKNIHFIGKSPTDGTPFVCRSVDRRGACSVCSGAMMHIIAGRLQRKVGHYTHFVTTLVAER